MNDTNERRPLLLLFMKAMVKKQIWVPGYTKRNGQVVAGAHKWVNVSNDEHDEHKIVSGQGTVSQKKAHEKLSKQAWFADASHEHKLAHVLHEGTKVADEKYMTDQLSRLKSNLLKGKKTLTGEWAAYHVAPSDKKAALTEQLKSAGKADALASGYEAWKAANPSKVKEAEELAASVAEHAKPLPAGTHEHEKHEPGSAAHEAAKPAQAAAKPEPKPEPKPESEKVPEAAPEAGKVVAAEEKKPEPAPEPEANPETEEKPAAPAAAGDLAMPDFTGGKNEDPKFVQYYEGVAKKIIEHAQAGNVSVLEDMKEAGLKPNAKTGKVGNTWKGKTQNSKKLLALYDAALAHANGGEQPMESAPDDIPDAGKELPKAVSDALLAHPEGMEPKTWDAVATYATNDDAENLKNFASHSPQETKDWIGNVLTAMGHKEAAAAALVDGSLKEDADKALAEGDMQTLKDILSYATKEGMTPTAEYAAKHIGELATKQAEAEKPTEPGAKPVKPMLSSITSSSIADQIEKLMEKGDLQGLKDQQTMVGTGQPAGTNFGKLEQYVKDAIAHVEAKNADSWAKPAHEPAAASLTDAEIGEPQGMGPAYAAQVIAAAKSGDMDMLKKYHNQNAVAANGPGIAFVQGLMDKLKAKNGPAAPAASLPVLDTSDMSDLHKDAAKAIHDLATKGSAVGHVGGQVSNLQDYYSAFDYAGNNLDDKKIAAYAKDALASLGEEAKHSGATAVPISPAANTGPKEGDTKMGADGMLVFKDGRWHKQGEKKDGPPAAGFVGMVKVPKLFKKDNASHAANLTKKIDALKKIAIVGGADEFNKAVKILPNGNVKVLGLIELSPTSPSPSVNTMKFAQYVKDLHAAVQGTVGDGSDVDVHETLGAKKPSGDAAAPAPKATGSTVTASESVDGWKQIGPQGGYNPGGTYEDVSGQQWYVKFPAGGEKIAKNELLATKLYALAGVEVPEVKLINQGGKIGLASKIIDGAVANKSALLEGSAKGLMQGFGADAWLANWDAVGNNPAAGKGFDNILIKPDGSAVRIDAGGALLYGGAGGKKQTFENEVVELKTMLDSSINPNTAAVFGKMSPADITSSVAKIANIPDHEIEGLVMEFGPGSESERTRLAEKLIARKHNMSEQYPTAKAKAGAAAKKAKPDPSALHVDAALLPSPHNFMDWQGTGKPISEKSYVKSNIADEQEILNLALQGNLTALKDYKFQPVDKLTGEAVGAKKSIDEHPSKYVQDFHGQVVSYLDMLANPPEELRPMTAKKANTLASLSAAFKPHDFGMTTAKAPKNQQIGFWIALGVAEDPNKFATPAKKLANAEIEAANAKHPMLPPKVKQFIGGVQGSGSYNNPYRDGLEKDHGGNDTREVLTQLYANATAHAAGTTIHKWINMPPELVKQFKDAPEGLVFQNPGSMCTSYSPEGTKGFGKDRITIRYAEGAKSLDSFASGSFKGEMEVTTLPGARFMVLSRKMVADTEHGKDKDQRFELELLMLPPDPTYVDNLQKKAQS